MLRAEGSARGLSRGWVPLVPTGALAPLAGPLGVRLLQAA